MRKTMFRWLIALAILLPCMILTTFATERTVIHSGYCGGEGDGKNLTWTLYDDGELVISGTGAMANYAGGTAPWYDVRSNIAAVAIGNGVSTIGVKAFYNCSLIKTITIPDGVHTFCDGAFERCYALTSVTIPGSVIRVGAEVFNLCTKLNDVVISDGVTTIGKNMFSGCGLTSITIPSSVTTIGNNAFSGANLETITISRGVRVIGAGAFSACNFMAITIPDSVTTIGDKAFTQCSKLTQVDFLGDAPDSVGSDIFNYCGSDLTVYYHEGTNGWPTDGNWQGRPLVMISHTHDAVAVAGKAPTCTETGLTEGSYCSACGEELQTQTVIPALGHNLAHHEGKEPTADSVGWKEYDACTRCDYSTYEELPKLEAVAPTRGKFSLEVINTIVVDGQKVDICRWVWTPIYD